MTETPEARFAAALASAKDRASAFAALGQFVETVLGIRLFTVTTLDYAAMLHRRIYSNMPEVYPVSGQKNLTQDDWSEQVIDRRQNYIANTIKEMGPAFYDADVFGPLGCGSVLNIPVVMGDQVSATLNLLDREGYFDPATVRRCEDLLLDRALACLALPE